MGGCPCAHKNCHRKESFRASDRSFRILKEGWDTTTDRKHCTTADLYVPDDTTRCWPQNLISAAADQSWRLVATREGGQAPPPTPVWGGVPATSSHRASSSPGPPPHTPSSSPLTPSATLPAVRITTATYHRRSPSLVRLLWPARFFACRCCFFSLSRFSHVLRSFEPSAVHPRRFLSLDMLMWDKYSLTSIRLSMMMSSPACRQRRQPPPATSNQSGGTSELASNLPLSDTRLADPGAWR